MTLPDTFDVATVRALHTDLLSALDAGVVTIDASQVQRADAAGLQLLVMASAAAAQRGIGFEIHSPSSAFLAVATTLGVRTRLGLH